MIPTPEQARELVEHFRTMSAAARAVEVARLTLRCWLYPEPQRTATREHDQNLSGVAYSRRLLKKRRSKALQRRAKREQRRTT